MMQSYRLSVSTGGATVGPDRHSQSTNPAPVPPPHFLTHPTPVSRLSLRGPLSACVWATRGVRRRSKAGEPQREKGSVSALQVPADAERAVGLGGLRV